MTYESDQPYAKALTGLGMGVVGGDAAKFQYQQNQPTQKESEIAYASRTADDSFAKLTKSLVELSKRLEPVLEAAPPEPSPAEKNAVRAISSNVAGAFLRQAGQAEEMYKLVNSLLRRLAV